MKNILLILLILLPFLCKSQNATLNKYFDAGIPTLNKNWTAQEYADAVNLLIELSKEGKLALPNTKNQSKSLFLKLSEFENYWFFNSEYMSDQDKMAAIGIVHKPLMQLLLSYITNSKETNGVFDSSYEIISLHILSIRLVDLTTELSKKYLSGHPKLNKIQQDGVKKTKTGLNTFISGNFITLKEEYINYQGVDICRLSKEFFDFYRKHRDYSDEVSRKEFDKNLNDIAKTHKFACVKNQAKL